eukprot:3198142-Prymnesium_polylepis.1
MSYDVRMYLRFMWVWGGVQLYSNMLHGWYNRVYSCVERSTAQLRLAHGRHVPLRREARGWSMARAKGGGKRGRENGVL